MKRLNRYTTLPVLLDMLKRKRLVLLDPASREDKNDSEILLEVFFYRLRALAAVAGDIAWQSRCCTLRHSGYT